MLRAGEISHQVSSPDYSTHVVSKTISGSKYEEETPAPFPFVRREKLTRTARQGLFTFSLDYKDINSEVIAPNASFPCFFLELPRSSPWSNLVVLLSPADSLHLRSIKREAGRCPFPFFPPLFAFCTFDPLPSLTQPCGTVHGRFACPVSCHGGASDFVSKLSVPSKSRRLITACVSPLSPQFPRAKIGYLFPLSLIPVLSLPEIVR